MLLIGRRLILRGMEKEECWRELIFVFGFEGIPQKALQRLSFPDLATLLWIWYPTGSPAVCPSRSSRTKDPERYGERRMLERINFCVRF